MEGKQSNLIPHLSKYWAIYLFLIQLIVTFTFGYARIGVAESKIAELESSQTAQDKIIDQQRVTESDIQAKLASIDTSLLYIRSALNIK